MSDHLVMEGAVERSARSLYLSRYPDQNWSLLDRPTKSYWRDAARRSLQAAAPKLHAHWLEQLKEELLSKEQIHALTQEIVEGSDGEVISLPYSTVGDALRERLQSLASIPIEEGQ